MYINSRKPTILWTVFLNYSYPIWIGIDTLSNELVELKRVSLVDRYFAKFCKDKILDQYISDVLITGEKEKTNATLDCLYAELAVLGVKRDSSLVALGGGVTGDIAGFAASSWMRGISLYQVPTTLLAMVDSSIGGKTGINISAGKNLVGSFLQPKAVFISTNYLYTLPRREFTAGISEIIKYGMLEDVKLFNKLEYTVPSSKLLNFKHPLLEHFIFRSCTIKSEIITTDEYENCNRRILLNLGHTFAHAIESASGYGTYLHGEAVGIGLVMAARLSEFITKLGKHCLNFTAFDTHRVKKLIQAYGIPIALGKSLPTLSALKRAMNLDKKSSDFIVMKNIGKSIVCCSVPTTYINTLWLELGAKG